MITTMHISCGIANARAGADLGSSNRNGSLGVLEFFGAK
jgi:hypothetical protein